MSICGIYKGSGIFNVGISKNNIDYVNTEINSNVLLNISILNNNNYKIEVKFENKLLKNYTSYGTYDKSLLILE